MQSVLMNRDLALFSWGRVIKLSTNNNYLVWGTNNVVVQYICIAKLTTAKQSDNNNSFLILESTNILEICWGLIQLHKITFLQISACCSSHAYTVCFFFTDLHLYSWISLEFTHLSEFSSIIMVFLKMIW